MTFYLLFLAPICMLGLSAHRLEVKSQRFICVVLVIALTMFAATRGYVGTDTGAYHGIFIDNRDSSHDVLFATLEPIFASLLAIVAFFTDSPFVYIASISMLQGLILVSITCRCKNPSIFLAMYASTFYVNFHFNILRSGVGALFLLLALTFAADDRRKEFSFFGALAVLSHYSTMIFLLPMSVVGRRVGLGIVWWLIPVIGLIILVGMLLSEARILQYFQYLALFNSGESVKFGFGLFALFGLYISIFLMSDTGGSRGKLAILLLLWCGLRYSSTIMLFVSRIEVVVSLILLFLLSERPAKVGFAVLRFTAIALLVLLNLYGVVLGLEAPDQSSRGGFSTNSLRISSPYLPYRFFWEE